MKRFAAVALVLVGLAVPGAFGQRGGGHGGGFGGGHGGFGAGFHSGGFAAPHYSGGFAYPHFSSGFSAPRFYGYSGAHNQPRYFGSYLSGPRSSFGYSSRANHSSSYHHRGGGIHWSIRTVPTVATLVPGWIGLGPYGYDPFGYGSGWDDPPSSDDAASAAPQPYEQAPEQQEQPAYREEYEPPAPMPAPTADPEMQDATTIVFNDGRPSEQIRNYALTGTTLYVLDAQRQNIPLDQINIGATQQANRTAGIDFEVPKIAQ